MRKPIKFLCVLSMAIVCFFGYPFAGCAKANPEQSASEEAESGTQSSEQQDGSWTGDVIFPR